MYRLRLFAGITYWAFLTFNCNAQSVELLHSGNGLTLRGLSVVNDKVVWVSGNKGTIGRSEDSGKTWEWITVPGFADKDFRDIEAFDASTVLIMAVGEPALILKTENKGQTWKTVYINNTPGMFLDAMEFWNEKSGIVVGDPVNGKFFVARTFDNGYNWRYIAFDKLPLADSGEACFAASGTNVRAMDRDEACFVSGGKRSRLFWKGETIDLPIVQGKETQGANSIAVWFKKRKKPAIVVVGGDFNADTSTAMNCAISADGGSTWTKPLIPPNGYRSCVEFIDREKLITCGLNGVDYSHDAGLHWNSISPTGFHVCRKAKKGNSVFLAGADGRIGKLLLY